MFWLSLICLCLNVRKQKNKHRTEKSEVCWIVKILRTYKASYSSQFRFDTWIRQGSNYEQFWQISQIFSQKIPEDADIFLNVKYFGQLVAVCVPDLQLIHIQDLIRSLPPRVKNAATKGHEGGARRLSFKEKNQTNMILRSMDCRDIRPDNILSPQWRT